MCFCQLPWHREILYRLHWNCQVMQILIMICSLYEYDDAELGEEILQRGLTTYLNDYNGTVKNLLMKGFHTSMRRSIVKIMLCLFFASKGYSTTETAKLTVSLDENGYFDEFEQTTVRLMQSYYRGCSNDW